MAANDLVEPPGAKVYALGGVGGRVMVGVRAHTSSIGAGTVKLSEQSTNARAKDERGG